MSELVPRQTSSIAVTETHPLQGSPAEQFPAKPRFVVFGSRISGAYGAADAFEKHLAEIGFDDARVEAVRDAAYIDDAFYNIQPATEAPELEPKKGGDKLRRLVRAVLGREIAPKEEKVDKDTPQGVIVFPQMRQYTPSGMGMFIRSPRDYIQELCDTNNVPVVFMEDIQSQAELAASLSAFAIEPK